MNGEKTEAEDFIILVNSRINEVPPGNLEQRRV